MYLCQNAKVDSLSDILVVIKLKKVYFCSPHIKSICVLQTCFLSVLRHILRLTPYINNHWNTKRDESNIILCKHCDRLYNSNDSTRINVYSEEKVKSVFMFSHKINNTAYIIVKFYT